MHHGKKCQIGVFLGSLESTQRVKSNGSSRRANEGVKALKFSIKATHVPKWAQGGKERLWELGGMGDGAGKRVMK
jgi:hypothetical protein